MEKMDFKKVMEKINLMILRSLRIMDFSSVFLDHRVVAALPETDGQGALVLAQRIEGQFQTDSVTVDGKQYKVLLRFGCASADSDAPFFPEQLVEQAEQDLVKKLRR